MRGRRLPMSSSDPRRPRGDLRTTNRQDSIDAPALVASSISRIKKINFFGPQEVSHRSLWTSSEPNGTRKVAWRILIQKLVCLSPSFRERGRGSPRNCVALRLPLHNRTRVLKSPSTPAHPRQHHCSVQTPWPAWHPSRPRTANGTTGTMKATTTRSRSGTAPPGRRPGFVKRAASSPVRRSQRRLQPLLQRTNRSQRRRNPAQHVESNAGPRPRGSRRAARLH